MKKIIIMTIAAVLINLTAIAQAVLPTNWSFTTTSLPTGWTENEAVFYTASGNTPPAKKFDSTGDFLIINFASNPGALTYYLAGNSFSGGTFTVEESALGSTWTPLHVFTAPPAGTYTLFTDMPQSTTRFIRFIYTNKSAGNIGLDDVNIAVGAAGPQQEINVKQGATTIVSGGTHVVNSPVSTTTPVTFTVENVGTANALNISSAVISGPNASDFTVTSFPSTVAANGTDNVVVNFTPSAAGNRDAILTIASDDADEPNYVINLYGIGGNLASEPATQPTALNFSNIKTYRVTGTFAPTTAEGYLVLRKTGSPITAVPTDGVVYQRGDIVGDAQVVYSDDVTGFSPLNIHANQTYYFAVFSYNGPSTFRNYNTTAPLSANVTTPATLMPSNYYNGISTAAPTFVADLHDLVNPHQMQFYSNYGITMVRLFAARDTTLNRRVVTCVYSGENKIYTEPFDFTANGYSREHSFPHSWMPTNPAQNLPEYNDYHHLFPTNQDEANAVRSNYPLGEVVTVSSTFLGAKFGQDINGRSVYEPRDEHKGDAARAIMYASICYTTVGGNSWAFPNPISNTIMYGQDQAILKQWHFQDLPDSYEISRNDFVDSLQGNRNPFIDSINFACYVNFTNMTYESFGCLADLEEALNSGFIVYPNPAKSELMLNVNATSISAYEITDMQGRVVLSGTVSDLVLVNLNIDSLLAGSYIVRATTPYGVAQKSVVIE